MQRYTTAYLNKLVSNINEKLGFGPNPPYPTIGAVGLNWAYGGVKIVKYTSTGGAEQDISRNGYGTKKQAGIFLEGMNHA